MNEENLIKYYNKFNENKRLSHRHGIVEFETTIKYIKKYLKNFENPKILDVGAGCGAYTIYLNDLGYDTHALELVKHNLSEIKRKNKDIKAYQGNAINLKRFKDKSFDVILLFGPMYHLISDEDKLKALEEAKRVLTDDGIIFISYYMNEYGIIKHGFLENTIKDDIKNNLVDDNYHIKAHETDLYTFFRLEDINALKDKANLKRIEIIAQDGPSDYIRPIINKMDDETFKIYLDYHFKNCMRPELLGASSHVLDILKK